MGALTLSLFIYGTRKFLPYFDKNITLYNTTIKSGMYWNLVLYLALISEPNIFTKLFEQSRFLKLSGRFSFGIYLYHPVSMCFVRQIVTKSIVEKMCLFAIGSFCIGYLHFYLLENPLMNVAQQICKKLATMHVFAKTTYRIDSSDLILTPSEAVPLELITQDDNDKKEQQSRI